MGIQVRKVPVNLKLEGEAASLQINHISDVICCNDFSTVTSERIIFLLCKLQYTNAHDLWNGYLDLIYA